jgi:hypothetical protein
MHLQMLFDAEESQYAAQLFNRQRLCEFRQIFDFENPCFAVR